jgi:hypothetical protein
MHSDQQLAAQENMGYPGLKLLNKGASELPGGTAAERRAVRKACEL